jgi:glutamate synthase domain-containing protein 2
LREALEEISQGIKKREYVAGLSYGAIGVIADKALATEDEIERARRQL